MNKFKIILTQECLRAISRHEVDADYDETDIFIGDVWRTFESRSYQYALADLHLLYNLVVHEIDRFCEDAASKQVVVTNRLQAVQQLLLGESYIPV